MSLTRRALSLLIAAVLLLEQPLWLIAQPQPPARAAEAEPGIVIIVEGVGGVDLIGKSARLTFRQAGVLHEIHSFVWTHGTGQYLKDLQDTQHALAKAEELAKFIKDYRARHPNRPIYIIGKSGGTGVVLFALRLCPPESIERVILLSAAVSPTFDLRPALRATKRELVSFHSRHDRMVLGLGTSHYGTIDRYYGNSAGLTGFSVPNPLSAEDRPLYMRLIQVPWSARMLREGNTGAHVSTSLPWFLTSEVVPWLR